MAGKLSDEGREKIRQANLGHKRNIGRKCKKKTRVKISKANKGRPCPEALKQALRKARTGIPLTPEHLQRIRDAKKKKLKCPHCDKVGGAAGMQKSHMNNCKEKKSCRSKKVPVKPLFPEISPS